jgi:hypothetical protein
MIEYTVRPVTVYQVVRIVGGNAASHGTHPTLAEAVESGIAKSKSEPGSTFIGPMSADEAAQKINVPRGANPP